MSASTSPVIRTARVYDAPDDGGHRVLVDRLWPRGVAKADLHAEWDKDVAPSDGLRRAFHGGDLPVEEFRKDYLDELRSAEGRAAVRGLLDRWRAAGDGDLVLLYAAKDEEQNHALVLAEHLKRVDAQRH